MMDCCSCGGLDKFKEEEEGVEVEESEEESSSNPKSGTTELIHIFRYKDTKSLRVSPETHFWIFVELYVCTTVYILYFKYCSKRL